MTNDNVSYELGPGMVNMLNPGEKVEIADAKRPSTNFDAFVTALSKYIGAALEIPVELLTKNFMSSYSASRAALLEAWKAFRMKRAWLAADFCQPIYEIFLIEAISSGRLKAPGFFLDPMIKKAYSGAQWNGPAQGMIDPVKEVNAAKERISIGISTRQKETIEMTGGDFEATINTVTGGGLDSMKAAYTNAGGGIKGIVSGAMAGIQTTTSTVMSALNTATGGKLEQLKNSFSEKLEGARSAALSKFESIKSGISEKLEGAKSTVRSGLSAISGFFSNVKLSLPHIKIPHFNISGGQAPWGIAGKGTAPKISVDWYKNGGILTGPTIFGANGNSLLGGGEAGKEAVLPLSELWSNMKTVVAGVMGSQPNAATEAYKQASELADGNSQPQTQTDSVTKELYNNITTNNTVNKSSEKNSSDNSSKIVYQPQIIIQGNASKEDVQSALDMSQEKFNAMMAEYERQNRRVSFA